MIRIPLHMSFNKLIDFIISTKAVIRWPYQEYMYKCGFPGCSASWITNGAQNSHPNANNIQVHYDGGNDLKGQYK